MREIIKVSDLFYEPAAYILRPDTDQFASFRKLIATLPHTYWLEATDIIEDTKQHYSRYNADNECKRLYAAIVKAMTGKDAPRVPLLTRHHDILKKCFRENQQTAIILNDAHLLKHPTLETFMADGKHFRESLRELAFASENTMRYEWQAYVYLVAVMPQETEMPVFPGYIANHIRTHLSFGWDNAIK